MDLEIGRFKRMRSSGIHIVQILDAEHQYGCNYVYFTNLHVLKYILSCGNAYGIRTNVHISISFRSKIWEKDIFFIVGHTGYIKTLMRGFLMYMHVCTSSATICRSGIFISWLVNYSHRLKNTIKTTSRHKDMTIWHLY